MRLSNPTLRLHAPRELRFRDEKRPVPGPGEVLLEVLSVGICRSDLDYYADGRIGESLLTEPLVQGHEFSARVIGAGPGVEPGLMGRRVAVEPAISCMKCAWCLRGDTNLCPKVRFCGTPPVDGGLRKYLVHPALFVAAIPESISDDAGAVLEPLAIGVHVLDLARPRLGQSAAIVGCGPVGLSILQAARAAGAGPIFVFDRLPWRLELALELGAAEAVDVGNEGFDLMRRRVADRQADLVFEAGGTDESPDLAVRLAAPGGKVFLVGIPPGDRTSFSAGVSRRRGLTVFVVRRSRNTLHRTIAMLERGRLEADRLVTHRFPFAEAPRAFSLAHNYEDGVVKAIIRVQE